MSQSRVDRFFDTVQKRYEAFVARQDKVMFELLKQEKSLQPRLTAVKIVAFILALLIHSSTILLVVLGVWSISSRFAGHLSICYGLLFFGIALAVRPQIPKKPDDLVSLEKFRSLRQLTDLIADDIPAPYIDLLAVDEFYNASFTKTGWRQSRLLTLGYPLWMKLNREERVGLLAHEMAHCVNGDFGRNFIVGSAMNTLISWYILFYPERLFHPVWGGILAIPAQLFMWVCANFVLLWILILRHLLFHESRRAEYLADFLGAQIAGSDAMISLLGKIQYQQSRRKPLPITTHPPTAYRIEFLKAKFIPEPSFTLSEEHNEKIDVEFSALAANMKLRIQQLRYRGLS